MIIFQSFENFCGFIFFISAGIGGVISIVMIVALIVKKVKKTFEAGRGKDDKQHAVEQLFREGDKTAEAVYDYFIDTEIEDVRVEELLGMKAKINTLDMIMDQLIELCRDMKGEE